MEKELRPMSSLYLGEGGEKVDLPESIRSIYGDLYIPERADRMYVYANFVSSIDGAVSLNIPGLCDGAQISGHSPYDAMIMGMLRSIADVVVIGKGTLMASPNHLWLPEIIFPKFKEEFRMIRASLNKREHPLTVVVTSEGIIEPFYRLFQTEDIPVLILTTDKGTKALKENKFPDRIKIRALKDSGLLTSNEILKAIKGLYRFNNILIEGGPVLLSEFLQEMTLDELFLTIAHQIVGRDESFHRPSLVETAVFNPGRQLWAKLCDIRKSEDDLFLRYSFR
ncbi:MAG: dihydrofolate reductase family protein [Bacteroidota bacterium]|nr:dihydrofolate reductase family protein [Bacteroidota bacterium]MDP4196839.1 dihydrofolate reductase family protein [Bacteroidota bacterium]